MTEWGLTSGDCSGKDLSGHTKKATLQGAPTSWGLEREGPARKGGWCNCVNGTHLWGPQREDTEGHRRKASDAHKLH
jgi:hypothetical protein